MDYRWFVFLVVSIGLIYVSWPSLREPRSYGFFRFFAFETTLILILLNLNDWFRSPFSPMQLISWVCLALSVYMALNGYILLRSMGAPSGSFENTSRLVRRGVYRVIRHPMYASLLWVGLGAFLKSPSVADAALLLVLLFFLIATAQVEEAKNLESFGEEYAVYMRETKRFIPFIL